MTLCLNQITKWDDHRNEKKIDLVYHENIAIISICNPPVNALV